MHSTNVVILLISIGSVLMESNLKEFCSKQYFDTFMISYPSKNTSEVQLIRKFESNKESYHSWNLLIEKQSEGYKTTNISYTLKEGQTPNSTLYHPSVCLRFEEEHEDILLKNGKTILKGFYKWVPEDMEIINDEISGPKVKYTETALRYILKGSHTVKTPFDYNKTLVINSSGLLLSGLLCRNETMFVIVEKTNSKDASNRRQFVSALNFRQQNLVFEIYNKSVVTARPSLIVSLEPLDKTIIDFFDIQCPDEPWMTTHILFVVFCVLSISVTIFLVIILILVIRRRRKPKISTNTDMPSDVTLTPGESTTTANNSKTETSISIQK